MFYAQSTGNVISGQTLNDDMLHVVSNLVFYAQSSGNVISGQMLNDDMLHVVSK